MQQRRKESDPRAPGRAGRLRPGLFAVIAALALAMSIAACGDDDDDGGGDGGGGGGGGEGGSIALLLPETKTARYETQDRPNFERKVKELCADCDIIYSNADQDAAQQQQQTEAAITQGAEVLVLDAVDAAAAAPLVTRAKSQDIPVISYDRLVLDADVDYYVSFDNEKVGQLQGESLVKKLEEDGADGDIVMINGAPTDNNATLFKKGAHSVIDDSPFKVAREYDTPDWSPDKAQQEMEQAITAIGKDGFVGVYAANDGTAGGAIAAMKSAGIDPKTRPTTGQDAELAAIQRILVDEQYMTVYKAIKPEAEATAELAVALLRGEEPPADLVNGEVPNGMKDVPSVLLEPVAVTKDNVNDTIVKDEFWSVDEICAGRYASACKEAGIQ
ncbi:MAG: ABC transporter substrate-binding protein [Thermoleophilaceae bacterium]